MKKPSSKNVRGIGGLQEQLKQAETRETERVGACELTRPGRRLREAYAKRGKNNAVDAEAICEAGTRRTTCFVAMKSAEQQAALSLNPTRNLLSRSREGELGFAPVMLSVFRGKRRCCLTKEAERRGRCHLWSRFVVSLQIGCINANNVVTRLLAGHKSKMPRCSRT